MKIDIPLGVPFRLDDHEVVAVTTYSCVCDGCFMKKHSDLTLDCHGFACIGEQRKDKQNVIFVEIKEGGEECR